MEEKQKIICKICDKSYASAKALGGHMRSHFAMFPLPPKPPQPEVPPATRRRSERRRGTAALSEEEAAQFLVELSRDKWPEKAPEPEPKPKEEEEEQGLSLWCCNKEFSSYQALGGHKANHKRMKLRSKNAVAIVDDDKEEEEEEVKSIFRCEYCSKEFGSGQALGGHKKAHFSTHLPKNVFSPDFGGTLVIDLNFPPPPSSDDQEQQVQVLSQEDFSTVFSN